MNEFSDDEELIYLGDGTGATETTITMPEITLEQVRKILPNTKKTDAQLEVEISKVRAFVHSILTRAQNMHISDFCYYSEAGVLSVPRESTEDENRRSAETTKKLLEYVAAKKAAKRAASKVQIQ